VADGAEAAASTQQRAADRLLAHLARGSRGTLVLVAGGAVLSAAAQTTLPATLGLAVDAALHGRGSGALLVTGSLLAVFVLGETLADVAAGAAGAGGTARLRHALVRHTLRLGVGAGTRFPSGDLVSRVVGGTAEAGEAGANVIWAVVSLLPTVGSLVALALIDIWLAVAFAAALPLLTLALRAFVRDTATVIGHYQRAQGALATLLSEAIGGARSIAAAGTLDRETTRVLGPLGDLRRHGRGMWRAQTRMAGQGALLLPLLEVSVLAVAGFELSAGRITAGELLAAGRYVTLGAGIGVVVTSLGQLARGRAGARRAAEVLAAPTPRHGRRTVPAGFGMLEFAQVSMRAPGGDEQDAERNAVLDGLDLVVPGGTCLAVVGRSGAGKSLLAALAGGLLNPDRGQVLLDGVPLTELDRASLRRAVGYAFERPVLIGATVRDAIGFGPRQVSLGQVTSAAQAARADLFVRRLPDGYDTPLTEAPMSGGEAQRIGLARAFAHGGRVLILDDATSSLDTVTELQVSRAITDALVDRTRIIVAHRVTTAARADLVAWLDGGRVRALGPHHVLWQDPAYRAVFDPDDGLSADALSTTGEAARGGAA
jgi:ATP-binding cassette subfamily B protein